MNKWKSNKYAYAIERKRPNYITYYEIFRIVESEDERSLQFIRYAKDNKEVEEYIERLIKEDNED